LLAQVRPLMEEVQRRTLAFQQLQADVDLIEGKRKGNGHLGQAKELEEKRRALLELRQSIARLVEEVQGLGVEVKDLSMGLVDFLALREGRDVYLCWRVGESRIDWWHTLEGGFSARQKL
jgi:hypothetical protein